MTHSTKGANGDAGAGKNSGRAHSGRHQTLGGVRHERLARLIALDAGAEKDDILALVAHEFRGPLAAISNALVLIDRRMGTQCARERAIVSRQVNTLARLVEDLVNAKRIARDGISVRCDHVSLRELIANALETTAPLRRTLHHQLRVRLPDAPLVVYADRVRLAQVFGNLLSNAARYTPQGGCIEIDVELDDNGYCVRVTGDGRGMKPEVLRHVFEPYLQGAESEDATPGGLGLGLALAKEITERHGGSLSVQSDGQGLGSEFAVRLPLPKSSARAGAGR